MLANCARFIERRCEGGGWPSYAELETEITRLRAELHPPGRYRCGCPVKRSDKINAFCREHNVGFEQKEAIP
jgi:hypothetical protein